MFAELGDTARLTGKSRKPFGFIDGNFTFRHRWTAGRAMLWLLFDRQRATLLERKAGAQAVSQASTPTCRSRWWAQRTLSDRVVEFW